MIFFLKPGQKLKSVNVFSTGENIEDTHVIKEQNQEVNIEDTGVTLQPGKLEMENKHHGNVVSKDNIKEQDDKVKDPVDEFRTPETETGASCLIKYNVSTTPYLQR
jgi:cytoskeleton-associated protein 2